MHAYYDYRAASTAPNILQDVVKLLTGTTSVAALSASAIQETSTIATPVPAGWVLYDNGGDPNNSVMLASNIDVSNFNGDQAALDASVAAGRTVANSKFMLVSIISTYISFRACEYGTTARVMVNECRRTNADSDGQGIDLTNGGTLRINASARHAVMYGNNRAKTSYGNYNSSPSGVFERTRRSAWDTNAAAYPVSVFMSGGNHIGNRPSFPRIRGVAGVDLTGVAAQAVAGSSPTGSTIYNGHNGGSTTDAVKTTVKTVDGSLKHMLRPLWPSIPAEAFAGGDISAFADFWQFTTNIGNVGDTTVCNGKTYEIWIGEAANGLGAGFRYAVRIA